jgi:hypothetical protein
MKNLIRLLLCCWAMSAMQAPEVLRAADTAKDWTSLVAERIPLYGHRNWIVIADSAYPAQSKDGIETVVANASQEEVLRGVMGQLADAKHVTPIIYTDQELGFLDDEDAPGVAAYRESLAEILTGKTVQSLAHEKLIAKLDEVSKTFRVLIIKTNMTIPYTSVFLQLDCAYWGPDAEKKLREKMAHGTK